jgi:hypothetical protein
LEILIKQKLLLIDNLLGLRAQFAKDIDLSCKSAFINLLKNSVNNLPKDRVNNLSLGADGYLVTLDTISP